jgi:hypothetical protein
VTLHKIILIPHHIPAGGHQPDTLQEVNVLIWTNAACRSKYGPSAPGGIVEHFLCAGDNGHDSCSVSTTDMSVYKGYLTERFSPSKLTDVISQILLYLSQRCLETLNYMKFIYYAMYQLHNIFESERFPSSAQSPSCKHYTIFMKESGNSCKFCLAAKWLVQHVMLALLPSSGDWVVIILIYVIL